MSAKKARAAYKDINPMSLPDVRLTDKNRRLAAVQPFTVANYMYVVGTLGYRLRRNIMSGEVEVWDSKKTRALSTEEAFRAFETIDDALIWLHISPARAFNVREVVAADDTYHPMADWIFSVPWDGVSRIDQLAATVPTDTPLWPIYLRKWLIQLMEAVFGWEDDVQRSLPHVLTFSGVQGMNKGRWIRALGAEKYVTADAELNLGGSGQKDSLLEVLSKPIAELGEIDSTFKLADVSSLKSFLSRPVDSIRRPYARNPIVRHRMTCFMGSVNRMEFLVDATGSRRFWPVAVRDGEKLQFDHGIDMQQVFAEMHQAWVNGEDWNLSDAEDLARIEDAKTFTETTAIAELADAYWCERRNNFDEYAMLNRTEICLLIGGNTHPIQLRQLGDWLQNNLGPMRRAGRKQRCWAWPAGAEYRHARIPAEEAKRYASASQRLSPWGLVLVENED